LIALSTFQEIYVENYPRMFGVALKMIGDENAASDVVQEVFISLFDRFNNGKEILYLNTWLYRAAINKSIDYLRKQKRFQSLESHKVCGMDTADEDLVDNREARAAINNAISRLKPGEKSLVVLYSEGLSYRDMSIVTGIKFSSIGKMLSRTLEKLKKELKKDDYELY
jgi:RNA polymerase sigma-70 factor, ECF subfamily